jgi:hypothetical protein
MKLLRDDAGGLRGSPRDGGTSSVGILRGFSWDLIDLMGFSWELMGF